MNSNLRGAALPRVATLLLLTLFLHAGSCCSRNTGPIVMGPERIVYRYAQSAFGVAFDVESDAAALASFLAATAEAATRSDVEEAWAGISELQAAHAGFLKRQVFDKAESDADWPADGSPVDEAAYVKGTRKALQEFLEGE